MGKAELLPGEKGCSAVPEEEGGPLNERYASVGGAAASPETLKGRMASSSAADPAAGF